MDPDEALKNAREAMKRIAILTDDVADGEGLSNGDSAELNEAAFDLMAAFEDLDGWLSLPPRIAREKGGEAVRQAIITKYHGPTNHRGARVSARSQAGRTWLAWDDAHGTDHNHLETAWQHANRFGWLEHHELVGGGLPDGTGNAYVLVPCGRKAAKP